MVLPGPCTTLPTLPSVHLLLHPGTPPCTTAHRWSVYRGPGVYTVTKAGPGLGTRDTFVTFCQNRHLLPEVVTVLRGFSAGGRRRKGMESDKDWIDAGTLRLLSTWKWILAEEARRAVSSRR